MIDTSELETEEVVKICKKYAEDHDIKHIIVASTIGDTALISAEIFSEDDNVIVVTHSTGFRKPNEQEMPQQTQEQLRDAGLKVLIAPMVFHSWNDYYRKKYGAILPTTIIADTLRIFGQGTKVAVEIIIMAMDAGLISNQQVMGIGGTGRGADTILIAEPSNSKKLFDMKIKDVVAKPIQW